MPPPLPARIYVLIYTKIILNHVSINKYTPQQGVHMPVWTYLWELPVAISTVTKECIGTLRHAIESKYFYYPLQFPHLLTAEPHIFDPNPW